MSARTSWSQERVTHLKTLWAADPNAARVAAIMGTSRCAIIGKTRRLNLHYGRTGNAITLAETNPAVLDARSIFKSRIRHPVETTVLKPEDYQRKLGGMVTKGRWAGMPIYALSLEERATCPRSCAMFRACYGNGMPHAIRFRHGAPLEWKIRSELRALSSRHPAGFVVRLHILGDFYSPAYVRRWLHWLRMFPALRVFGYTAWQPETPIGKLVRGMSNGLWDRFAVRTSGAKTGLRTNVISDRRQARGSIICPAQSDALAARGKQISCGTCALCWQSQKPITFMKH